VIFSVFKKSWKILCRESFFRNFFASFFFEKFLCAEFFSESFLEDRVEILCFELSVAARAEGDEVRRVVAAAVSRGDDVVDGEVAGTAAVDALVSVSLSDLTSGLLPVVAVELGSAGA
jgi:hypothetical protein